MIAPDLRGYGDSGKPAATSPISSIRSAQPSGPDRSDAAASASNASLSPDMIGAASGAPHGVDHAATVERIAVLASSRHEPFFRRVDKALATSTYHWFFLIQPSCRRRDWRQSRFLSGMDVRKWVGDFSASLRGGSRIQAVLSRSAMIHASCEDYRAGASIDLEHDEADLARKGGLSAAGAVERRAVHPWTSVLKPGARAPWMARGALDCATFCRGAPAGNARRAAAILHVRTSKASGAADAFVAIEQIEQAFARPSRAQW